jgi:hypothetical protein
MQMASPPPQSTYSISNKFRAEPFVNLTAESLEALHGPEVGQSISTAGDPASKSSALMTRTEMGRPNRPGDERDELAEDDDEDDDEAARSGNAALPSSSLRTRFPTGRLSTTSLQGGLTPSYATPVSDIQRDSVTSTSSSSSARRSSYDPNEPGVLEKIHTGQGKSKRKPISVQQWGMMNTFKIRPADASQSIPIPPSIPPNQRRLSATSDYLMEEDSNISISTEKGNPGITPATPTPTKVSSLVTPQTNTGSISPLSNSSVSKPSRKRIRSVLSYNI